MSIIHLNFAKGKDMEGKCECDRFVTIARERFGEGEHPTFPAGVYLRRTYEGPHKTGLIVEYAPAVAGASKTAQRIAAEAEEIWKEARKPMKPYERILKRVKMDGAEHER